MGGFSWIHWAVVIILVVVLFGGRGKISDVMGDFARGIKSFKKGLSDQDDTPTPQVRDDTKDKTH